MSARVWSPPTWPGAHAQSLLAASLSGSSHAFRCSISFSPGAGTHPGHVEGDRPKRMHARHVATIWPRPVSKLPPVPRRIVHGKFIKLRREHRKHG